MSIPVTHPFWLALAVAVPVAVISGLVVYFQAWRAITRVPEARDRLESVRSTAGLAAAFLALLVGVGVGLGYGALDRLTSGYAAGLYLAVGAVVFLVLSAWAIGGRARRGAAFATVALNAVWAIAYGYVLPLMMHSA
ncbi:MAG: hypothetical protein KC776_16380 [Myxococcales bacterium]|nr:hypothetical protein [Myxococcales bacterium]MCB9578698.1 hypothetical protein [Polyangiaceae bacterium]